MKFFQIWENNVTQKVKSFWHFIEDKKKIAGFPNLMFLDGTSAHSEDDIAKLFSWHFEPLFCSGGISSFSETSIQREIFDDEEIIFNEVDINTAIHNLKAPNSVGPDGIPDSFVKQFRRYLSKPLLYLFRLSISSGVIPLIWKSSYLKPIFKKGDRTNIKNYRPVCILSAIPKILDTIITNKISKKVNKIVSEKQHGFQEKKSTIF